jgi:hypothetical protein
MGIKGLTAIIPPPPRPVDTNLKEWPQVEAGIGYALPPDYRQFCVTYGRGSFADPTTRIDVLNLLSPTDRKALSRECEDCELLRTDEDWPHRVHPARPGLLLWGRDVDGNRLFWLTEGKPAKWPVLVYPHGDAEFIRFDIPLTTFLAKAFKKEINTLIWGPKKFAERSKLTFVPRTRG